jgi:hypothetical protein
MAKPKKKLTSAQRAARKQRMKDFMTVFINGKQLQVRRPVTYDGLDEDEWIRDNADDIWLHQHGYWDILDERYAQKEGESEEEASEASVENMVDGKVVADEDIPF